MFEHPGYPTRQPDYRTHGGHDGVSHYISCAIALSAHLYFLLSQARWGFPFWSTTLVVCIGFASVQAVFHAIGVWFAIGNGPSLNHAKKAQEVCNELI